MLCHVVRDDNGERITRDPVRPTEAADIVARLNAEHDADSARPTVTTVPLDVWEQHPEAWPR